MSLEKDGQRAKWREYSRAYYHRKRQEDPEWVERQRSDDRARKRLTGQRGTNTPASAAALCANQRSKKLGVTGIVTAADIDALWERQPVCVACGVGRGVDHVVDLTNGGPNLPSNLQTLCKPCNSAKYQRPHRRLTFAQAEEIRARRADGEGAPALGRAFGISPGAVNQIVAGRTYNPRHERAVA